MSFSAKIKEEIFQSRPARKPHYRAFCYGLLLFGRRFGPQGIEAATEHPAVSKLCGWAIRDAVGARPSLSEQKSAARPAALYRSFPTRSSVKGCSPLSDMPPAGSIVN